MIRLRNLPFVGLQLTLMADKSQTPLPAWFVQMMDKYEHIEHETCDIDSQRLFCFDPFLNPFQQARLHQNTIFRRKNRLQKIGLADADSNESSVETASLAPVSGSGSFGVNDVERKRCKLIKLT